MDSGHPDALDRVSDALRRARCAAACAPVMDQWGQMAPASDARLPACGCGAWLRPDVVWFGEAPARAAVDRAVDAVRRCDGLPALERRL